MTQIFHSLWWVEFVMQEFPVCLLSNTRTDRVTQIWPLFHMVPNENALVFYLYTVKLVINFNP